MYRIKKKGIGRHYHTGEVPVRLVFEVNGTELYVIGAYPANVFGLPGWVCLCVFDRGDGKLSCGQFGLTEPDIVWSGEITDENGMEVAELTIDRIL